MSMLISFYTNNQNAALFTSSFKLDSDMVDLAKDVEIELLPSPRCMIVDDSTLDSLIAYPISGLVKRGIKAILQRQYFSSSDEYDEFIHNLNERSNGYVVIDDEEYN